MAKKPKLEKPLVTPNLAKQIRVKLEFNGNVKAENIKLYNLLFQALKQIIT